MFLLIIHLEYLDTVSMLIILIVYKIHGSIFSVLGTRAISHLCSSICSCNALARCKSDFIKIASCLYSKIYSFC